MIIKCFVLEMGCHREWSPADAGPGRRSQLDDSGAARSLARLDAERAALEAAALREATRTPPGAAGGRSNGKVFPE
jgi:hypothetical protein